MPSYGSPRGLFVGKSIAQLLVLQTTFEDQLVNGRYTATSGAQKSATLEYGAKPDDLLAEVLFALQKLGYIAAPPSRVTQDFTGLRRMPNTVTG